MYFFNKINEHVLYFCFKPFPALVTSYDVHDEVFHKDVILGRPGEAEFQKMNDCGWLSQSVRLL